MHQLTTETRSLFERVAEKYVEMTIVASLESPYHGGERDPLVLDSYGYNRTYIDVALETEVYLQTVPMFLAWFEYNRSHLSAYVHFYEHACEMYLQGHIGDGEWFAPFEPIFLDGTAFSEHQAISEDFYDKFGEENWVCRFLHTIVFESTSDILESMGFLDGVGFTHLRDTLRLSFIETNFSSYDPDEETEPELRFQAADKLFESQRELMEMWSSNVKESDQTFDGACTHLVNPPRGGGFSCIS